MGTSDAFLGNGKRRGVRGRAQQLGQLFTGRAIRIVPLGECARPTPRQSRGTDPGREDGLTSNNQ